MAVTDFNTILVFGKALEFFRAISCKNFAAADDWGCRWTARDCDGYRDF